jgi:hypothetical protein
VTSPRRAGFHGRPRPPPRRGNEIFSEKPHRRPERRRRRRALGGTFPAPNGCFHGSAAAGNLLPFLRPPFPSPVFHPAIPRRRRPARHWETAEDADQRRQPPLCPRRRRRLIPNERPIKSGSWSDCRRGAVSSHHAPGGTSASQTGAGDPSRRFHHRARKGAQAPPLLIFHGRPS